MPERSEILDRHYKGIIRLNTQHWLANLRQGFLVHPAVKLGQHAVIGDLGTGTRAWIFELLPKLPPTTTYDGIDIELGLFPHEKWLPKNVHGVVQNIYEPIQASIQQKYDYLHVRYFGIYVEDNDPTAAIKQMIKLVKPGGYLQWTENDLWKDHIAKASDDLKTSSTEQLYIEIMKILGTRFGERPGWTRRLGELFKSCGLVDVVFETHTPEPHMWPAIHDNFLSGWEEVSRHTKGSGLEKLFDEATGELAASGRGIAFVGHAVTVVGRVPEN